jgi:hypothetical protein
MTILEVFLNLVIGIIGGAIASILVLVGNYWFHRKAIERRLGLIAGDYTITSNTRQYDTSKERVEIRLISERTFSISATGGPTGDWTGQFILHDESMNVAHGIYQYQGSTDWGQHEYLFNESTDSIFVYGVNRSKPGLIEPFSLVLSRSKSSESTVA